jgi:hypothetical protein
MASVSSKLYQVNYIKLYQVNYISKLYLHAVNYIKSGFHMVVTVVKIEPRSFSSAEIQHFRTENTRSGYN